MSDAHELAATVVPSATVTGDAERTFISGANRPGGQPAQASTTVRTTVLPQVRLEGNKPSLSLQTRERFEEVAPLGEGGMGEVVLVKDHDIDRAVALKRLRPEADLGAVLRFVDEIRVVGSLEHPNIVPVHDVGVDDRGRYFFLMKHLKGETLATIIERLQAGDPEAHRRFTFTVRQQLFLGVLNAVAYAHGQGVIHRDLKPANIMVGPFGEVTVMDWGLARRIGASELPLPPGQPIPLRQEAGKSAGREIFRTQAGVVMGTPLYMSPEQARGAHDEVDERTDTYALTVILHELMSLSHYLDDTQPVEQILKDVQTVKPSVVSMKKHPTQPMLPAEVAWFVDKGLEKDRTRRYQNVQEMIETLQRGLGAHVAVQCHRTLIKRVFQEVATRADAHPIAVMVGGVTVMGLFVAAVVKSLLVLGGN